MNVLYGAGVRIGETRHGDIMKKTYFLGLVKGTGNCECWANGHRRGTVVLEARRDKDLLSPWLWRYLGERGVTKVVLRQGRAQILTWVNQKFGQAFSHIVID